MKINTYSTMDTNNLKSIDMEEHKGIILYTHEINPAMYHSVVYVDHKLIMIEDIIFYDEEGIEYDCVRHITPICNYCSIPELDLSNKSI